MFQNSVDVVIAVFKAFLKKIKKRNHSTLRQTCLEKYQFFVLRFLFIFLFCDFFALDSIEVGYSGVKFVGRNRGWFGGSMAFNIYH